MTKATEMLDAAIWPYADKKTGRYDGQLSDIRRFRLNELAERKKSWRYRLRKWFEYSFTNQ